MDIFPFVLEWAIEKKMQYNQGENSVSFLVEGQNGSFRTKVMACEPEGLLYIYSEIPALVAENRKMEVSKYLTKKNLVLKTGTFVFNYETGEVGFRLGQFLLTKDKETIKEQVDAIVLLALNITSAYYKEILSIIVQEDK